MKTTFTTNDWERLRVLRQRFLGDASEDYWQNSRDLELYDQVYAERIGWKWRAALENLTQAGWQPHSKNILDWGCGTGIASRSVISWSGIQKVFLVDQSALALAFAQKKLSEQKINATFFEKENALEPSKLMLISHVAGELSEKELLELATKAATADEVIWLEPGSHNLSRSLSNLRKIFIHAGHQIIAPCVHQDLCPILESENEKHWCHFFARPPIEIFQSAFWHQASRGLGIDLRSLPYSYFASSRFWKPKLLNTEERLIGHPRVLKAHCKLLCCGTAGLKERTLQKRDQPELFRKLVKKEIDGLFSWNLNN